MLSALLLILLNFVVVSGWSPPTKLIPRQLLFGNADYSSPLLSPDGNYLLYFSPCPTTGVLNAWIRHLSASSSSDEMLHRTNNATRPIRPDQVFWAEDSRTILFLEDEWGDEIFRLHAATIASSTSTTNDNNPTRYLTPPSVKVTNVLTNARFPDQIWLGMNERDPTLFDMYRCNLTTGELYLDVTNPGSVIQWQAHDDTFQIRVANAMNEIDDSKTIRVRDSGETHIWRDLITFPHGEEGRFVTFCKDNTTCLVTSSLGLETTALLRLDLQTGQLLEKIFAHDKCDIEGVMVDKAGEPRVIGVNYDKHERHFFDSSLEDDYRILQSLAGEISEVSVCSKARNERLWVVKFQRWEGPEEYKFYDTTKKNMAIVHV